MASASRVGPVNATVAGGSPPFHYTISFSQDVLKPIQGDSSDGVIHKDVQLPSSIDSTKPLDLVVQATDNKLRTVSTKAQPAHVNVVP